jgi:excisionase family DNA binding protein
MRRLENLESHPEPYVTVAELADYWLVGRKQIYKQIDAGTLPAIRLGPRLLRIRTADAREFERRANMRPQNPKNRDRVEGPGHLHRRMDKEKAAHSVTVVPVRQRRAR